MDKVYVVGLEPKVASLAAKAAGIVDSAALVAAPGDSDVSESRRRRSPWETV